MNWKNVFKISVYQDLNMIPVSLCGLTRTVCVKEYELQMQK